MKRIIIPIHIQSGNILISSYSELLNLAKKNINLYTAILLSGDAQRMCYSYCEDLPEIEGIKDNALEIGYLCEHLDPLEQTGEINLLAIKYKSHNNIIKDKLKLLGMHKHKTCINFDGATITIDSHVSFKYLLLKNVNFIINDNAKIRLSHSMLDNVYIKALSGSKLEFIDIEFSNNINDCVYLKEGATISLHDNVRFFDVRNRYKIENAKLENVGKLFNFTCTNSIISFLETSDIYKIDLIGDFDYPGKELALSKPIEFTNSTGDDLKINIKKLIISNDLIFNGNFIVSADIFVKESIDLKISLSYYFGILKTVDSENLQIFKTHLLNNQGSFDFKSSSVSFSSSSFKDTSNPVHMSNSSLTFKDACSVEKVDVLCCIYEHEFSNDELLTHDRVEKNSVHVYDSNFISSKILNTKKLNTLEIKKTTFSNNNTCFDIEDCEKIIFSDIKVNNTLLFADIRSSYVTIIDSEFKNGKSSLVLDNSHIDITRTILSDYKEAIVLNDTTAEISKSVIKNNEIGITLSGKETILRHGDMEFMDNRVKAVLQKPGTTIINTSEESAECIA